MPLDKKKFETFGEQSHKPNASGTWDEDYELVSLNSSQDALNSSFSRSIPVDSNRTSSPLRIESLSSSTIMVNTKLREFEIGEGIPETQELSQAPLEKDDSEEVTKSIPDSSDDAYEEEREEEDIESKEEVENEEDESIWESDYSEAPTEPALAAVEPHKGKAFMSPSSSGTYESEALEYDVPAVPDLRFQNSYLKSLEQANGSIPLICWITVRDQILFPFLSGGMWIFVRHFLGFMKIQEKGFHFGQWLRRTFGFFFSSSSKK
ncbi:mitophagy receptor Atg43 [Schizosaccharomyces osmophilus]|uniref:Mitophagy receptor Atg43 n=1 Tax=Schizosaccharomyces osmophilus TaxID=2545709 RepID=A0AAE9WEF1_9SCHI|nr:mitophagy receptor Atg43 [Schizosaccharomyces osmophilus]WBW74335.1 mitophagy receptor Atg43 [Schizosaccharomyces osmophilus]